MINVKNSSIPVCITYGWLIIEIIMISHYSKPTQAWQKLEIWVYNVLTISDVVAMIL